MVRANQVVVIAEKKLSGRPAQRTTLVGADIHVRPRPVYCQEYRHVARRPLPFKQNFLSTIVPEITCFAQVLQFDSPRHYPHVWVMPYLMQEPGCHST